MWWHVEFLFMLEILRTREVCWFVSFQHNLVNQDDTRWINNCLFSRLWRSATITQWRWSWSPWTRKHKRWTVKLHSYKILVIMCSCFLLIDVKARPTVHQFSDEGSVQDSVVFCGFAVQVCSSRGWWSWTRTCWSWREETCCWRGRSSAWRYRSSERSWPGRLLEMKFEPRSPNPLKKNAQQNIKLLR